MSIALSAHYSLKLVFLITALAAVFLRLGSNFTRNWWKGRGWELLDSGHRFFGWIGIISIMALLFFGNYAPDSEPNFIDRLVQLHIPLLLICTAAILYKAYLEEGNPLQQVGMVKFSWLVIFVLGAFFSFAIAAMFIRKFGLFQAYLPALYAIPYSILVILHAGLAFAIVVIRYLQKKMIIGGNTEPSSL